jgi:hypothetical protein
MCDLRWALGDRIQDSGDRIKPGRSGFSREYKRWQKQVSGMRGQVSTSDKCWVLLGNGMSTVET